MCVSRFPWDWEFGWEYLFRMLMEKVKLQISGQSKYSRSSIAVKIFEYICARSQKNASKISWENYNLYFEKVEKWFRDSVMTEE